MEKRKVLFITPSLCQGGIERSQIIMLQMLDQDRYDLTLMLYHDDVTLLPLVPPGVRVVLDQDKTHYFRKPGALYLNGLCKVTGWLGLKKKQARCQEKLRSYIHDLKGRHPAKDVFNGESFDVVVSNAIGICTEMALYIPAEKHIVWYRASVDMHHEMLAAKLPQYDDIIAVSHGVKQMLSENYPDICDKIRIVNNYVSAEEVLTKAADECQISVPTDRLVLCSCGRFTAEKGFDLAIQAARILTEQGIEFVWYFIGDGADRPKLEEQIHTLALQDKIVITGFSDNPFPLMKKCDIYIQPSYEESFGRTIKEAVILRKPVVSTDTAGAREILGGHRYGVITSVDAAGIADGIMRIRGEQIEYYTKEMNQAERDIFMSALDRYLS